MSAVKSTYRWLRAFGFDPRRTYHAVRMLPRYLSDYRRYTKAGMANLPPLGSSYPVLEDLHRCRGRHVRPLFPHGPVGGAEDP